MILKTSGRQALREETEKTNTDLNLRCGHRRHSQTELDNKPQTQNSTTYIWYRYGANQKQQAVNVWLYLKTPRLRQAESCQVFGRYAALSPPACPSWTWRCRRMPPDPRGLWTRTGSRQQRCLHWEQQEWNSEEVMHACCVRLITVFY